MSQKKTPTKNVKPKYEYKEGYIIPKAQLTKPETINLINSLTLTPTGNDDFRQTTADPTFKVFREDATNYYAPKFWAIQKFGTRFPQPVPQKNSAVNFNFNGTLRGSQPEVSAHILKKLTETDGGLLQLHTGYGKTTLAIYIASILKLKTLVIVHKTFLQDQWDERIRQFTDAEIGMIRQKKVDVEGKDIVIGMLQSISMIDYDPSIFNDFDLVIVDECHHIASKVYSQSLFKLNPKYTIALSATPHRSDGMTKAIHWFMGDTIVKVERKSDNIVYVKAFDYETVNPFFTVRTKNVKGKIKPDIIKMTTNLCKIDERNIFIIKTIDELKNIPNRKMLVLSKRIEHLKTLKKMMDDKIDEQVKNNMFCDGEYTTSFYVGGMKEWQLRASAEADIIFATYDIASEGLDIDGLNTLVLANSVKDPVQAIGRVLRKPLAEGDINPLIIDICDNLSCYSKWAKDRIKYYKTNKYKVDYVKVNKDSCISMYEYMLKNKIIDGGEYDMETLRKIYIEDKLGVESYEFEKRLKFRNFPDAMFEKEINLKKLFDINHDFTNIDLDQGSIIDYDPVTPR